MQWTLLNVQKYRNFVGNTRAEAKDRTLNIYKVQMLMSLKEYSMIGDLQMKLNKILIVVTILIIAVYIAVLVKYANTPISQMPSWVFWLIYK